jgi:hypothetical protein
MAPVRRVAWGLAAIALLASGLTVGGLATAGGVAGAQASGGMIILPSSAPAFDADAPDPDVVRDGPNYYAFTTGTALGNHIQALVDTSGSPQSGWRSYTGQSVGSTALPAVPAWEQMNTQTSPGVFSWNGKWVMYYDASQSGHAADTGFNCLSVATATRLALAPVFTDSSSRPLLCQTGLGGSIDPSPFVDPATGHAYLVWKSNDGGSNQPARLWSQQLSGDGMSLVGSAHQLLTQDTNAFPWETTVENPQMVNAAGMYFLLFSTGTYNSSSYAETYATCAGPDGPCTQTQPTPILSSYGSASGPGGGSLFQDASGSWMIDYAAWKPGCSDYSCGGQRRLFVAPVSLSPPSFALAPPVTGMASTPTGDGYWLTDGQGAVTGHGAAQDYGSMAGRPLNAPIDHIVATPDGKGYWLVASDGGTFTFGDAGFYGSMGGQHLNAPVVDIAPTRDGLGYWLVASDGGIFSFGDASFRGSMGSQHLNQPVVGISPNYATGGYWEVASDGGIFSFGAPFLGSTGNLRLNRPVNAMAVTADGGGYWFVASEGGIFSFGDAPFRGSMGGSPLNAPVVGMGSDATTGGYWLVASDGGIFSFGDAPFRGSMGGSPLNAPVVGMGSDATTGGYWLVASDGGIFSFGAPFYGAD